MNISRLYTVDDIEGPLDGYYFLRVSALLIAKAKHFQLSGLYDSHLMWMTDNAHNSAGVHSHITLYCQRISSKLVQHPLQQGYIGGRIIDATVTTKRGLL